MLLPDQPGTYILILRLDPPQRVRIGALGTFDFPAAHYAYVGSAFGPGGLRGRLRHHLAPVTRPHWHIDYLRAAAHIERIAWGASDQRLEHDWARRLLDAPGAFIPAPRFGASDCRCPAHLIGFRRAPDLDAWLGHTASLRIVTATWPTRDRRRASTTFSDYETYLRLERDRSRSPV